MSLSDEIEVRIAGNLCQPVTLRMRDGTTLATTNIAASPTALVDGRLEQRETTRVVELPRADGDGTVAVRLTRQELVVVVERLLYVAPPSASHVVEA